MFVYSNIDYIFVLSNIESSVKYYTLKYNKYCEVMKLADMPSCLGGEDHATNAR